VKKLGWLPYPLELVFIDNNVKKTKIDEREHGLMNFIALKSVAELN